MYYVYILKSKQKNIFYVGYSEKPRERINYHNSSINSGWTKKYKPWICIYLEAYQSKKIALKREKILKKKDRNWTTIMKRINDNVGGRA